MCYLNEDLIGGESDNPSMVTYQVVANHNLTQEHLQVKAQQHLMQHQKVLQNKNSSI